MGADVAAVKTLTKNAMRLKRNFGGDGKSKSLQSHLRRRIEYTL
jgi:hypothetical protein